MVIRDEGEGVKRHMQNAQGKQSKKEKVRSKEKKNQIASRSQELKQGKKGSANKKEGRGLNN